MIAGFLAAYMSTIGTQLNLGAAYLTNDLYRRFIRPHASEQHYVWVSRATTIGVCSCSPPPSRRDGFGQRCVEVYAHLTAGLAW